MRYLYSHDRDVVRWKQHGVRPNWGESHKKPVREWWALRSVTRKNDNRDIWYVESSFKSDVDFLPKNWYGIGR